MVYGFLRQLAQWTVGAHELVILSYASSPPPAEIAGDHIAHVSVTDRARNWAIRSAWEFCKLPRVVRRHAVDMLFTVSGAMTPGLKVPQVSLAQNPWCFVPQARRGAAQELKAKLQLRGYRKAWRDTAMMFFISDHLRNLYRSHACDQREAPTDITFVGLDDDTHESAARMRTEVKKDPLLIVSVSAMVPWKGTDTLVNAMDLLRQRGVDAKLRLVGPWPQPAYRQQIEHRINELGLSDHVTITGHVNRDELHRHYAEAQVFCLMSCCESFGIPAAEAMAFGTPVVATQDCAISEICRDAGLFGPADNPEWTADSLTTVLTQSAEWQTYSRQATANASRLRWENCARPLMQMFSLAI